jgi:hypothetical protein
MRDSCITTEPLVKENVIEAYWFQYGAFMCPYETRFVLRKFKDSTSLVTTVYQFGWYDQPCLLIEETQLNLSQPLWEEFQEVIERCDYWGLNSYNDHFGTDGSSIVSYGYKLIKDSTAASKKKFIYRWSPTFEPIMDPFYFLLKVTKIKSGCLTSN